MRVYIRIDIRKALPLAKHAKEVHGYTKEQLNDPKMMEMIKSVIKTD